MGQLAERGQRAGYLLVGAAIAGFVGALLTGFPGWLAGAVVACMAVGSAVLLPAVILGYAVRAAEREDRERGL